MLNNVIDSLTTQSDFYLQLAIEHLAISMISVLIAGILGLLIGIFISEYEKTSGIVLTIINIIYTIPSISLLGLLIPFSGIGNKTAIIALIIYALLPMVRNTHTGITNIDPTIVEAAEGMGSTRFEILYKIKIPMAAPIIMSGLRNMTVMTIALTGIASFIGAGGLGVAIYRGITTNNMAMTLAGSLLIAIIAFAMDFLVSLVERYFKTRHSKNRKFYLIPIFILIAGSLLLIAHSFMPQKKEELHIATKPMTEQYILGEILKAVIEDETNLSVVLTEGVGGGTSNIFPAMESGEFDLYPEYTGTGWNAILKKEGTYNEDQFEPMNDQFKADYHMEWLGFYGFNNTYAIAVQPKIVEKFDLKTCSDLGRVSSELSFGAEYDYFEREDGYNALKSTYGMNFSKTMDLDIGLKYQAMEEKQIDATVIFTTDGQLADSGLVVLEDDKHLQTSYLCGNIVREEVLDKHPELAQPLQKLEGTISNTEMSELNNQVETHGKEPQDVARDYLVKKGLLSGGDN